MTGMSLPTDAALPNPPPLAGPAQPPAAPAATRPAAAPALPPRAPRRGSAAAVRLAAERLSQHRALILASLPGEGQNAAAGEAPAWSRWLQGLSVLAPLLGLGRLRSIFSAERLQGGPLTLAQRHPKTLLLASAAAGSVLYLLLPRVWRRLLWPVLLAEGHVLFERSVRDALLGALTRATGALAAVAPAFSTASPDASPAASSAASSGAPESPVAAPAAAPRRPS